MEGSTVVSDVFQRLEYWGGQVFKVLKVELPQAWCAITFGNRAAAVDLESLLYCCTLLAAKKLATRPYHFSI